MCIALPGKVLEIDGTGFFGTVDFQGNRIDVTLGAVDAKVGDYVLVHAGNAIEVVTPDVAEDVMALFAELEAAYGEDVVGGEDEYTGKDENMAEDKGMESAVTGNKRKRGSESVFPLFREDS